MDSLTEILSIGEECIGAEKLGHLLQSRNDLVAYDGFEPSGKIHIAQGILKAVNVNTLTKHGINFTFLIADYFAQLQLGQSILGRLL